MNTKIFLLLVLSCMIFNSAQCANRTKLGRTTLRQRLHLHIDTSSLGVRLGNVNLKMNPDASVGETIHQALAMINAGKKRVTDTECSLTNLSKPFMPSNTLQESLKSDDTVKDATKGYILYLIKTPTSGTEETKSSSR